MSAQPAPIYETRDFYFAATLVALGMELLDLDRAEPWRAKFVFRDDERRRQWTRDYFAGRLRLDPLVLFHSSRALKRAVHNDGGELLLGGAQQQRSNGKVTLVRSTVA